MVVYGLAGLPYARQPHWRQKHCPTHAGTAVADIALIGWEFFDAFAHHRRITQASPEAGPSAEEEG